MLVTSRPIFSAPEKIAADSARQEALDREGAALEN